jgi:hypothetical protein
MRSKIPRLQGALAGRFNEHHALLCRAMLARVDQADVTIDTLAARIDNLLDPYEAAVSLLVTVPGIARCNAQVILAEIGVDMSRFRPPVISRRGRACAPATTSPPANTARDAPVTDPNGSARRSSKRARPRFRGKNTYLAAQYAQIRGRRGPQRVAVAVGHSILVIAWHLLRTREAYNDLGATTSTGLATAQPANDDSSPNSKPWVAASPSNPQPPDQPDLGAPPRPGAYAPAPQCAPSRAANRDSHLSPERFTKPRSGSRRAPHQSRAPTHRLRGTPSR